MGGTNTQKHFPFDKHSEHQEKFTKIYDMHYQAMMSFLGCVISQRLQNKNRKTQLSVNCPKPPGGGVLQNIFWWGCAAGPGTRKPLPQNRPSSAAFLQAILGYRRKLPTLAQTHYFLQTRSLSRYNGQDLQEFGNFVKTETWP